MKLHNKFLLIIFGFIIVFAFSVTANNWFKLNPMLGDELDITTDGNFSGSNIYADNATFSRNVTASWFKGAYDWVLTSIAQRYLSFNGTKLDINESQFNSTYVNSVGDTVSGYLNVTGTSMFFSKLITNQTQVNNAPTQCSYGYNTAFNNMSAQICTAIQYAPGNFNVTGNITNVKITKYDSSGEDCNSCTHCMCYNGTHMRMNG